MVFIVCKADNYTDGWFISSNKDMSLYVTRDGYIINMCYNFQLKEFHPESFKNLYFDSKDEANKMANMVNGYDWNKIANTFAISNMINKLDKPT